MTWMAIFLTGWVVSAAPASKLSCTNKELARRDCRLISGEYNLRLLEKTVAWNDGTWHTVDPMPLTGEGIEWEQVRFDFLNKHPILQLWLWDKGVGEAGVQSLHWYVADAEKRKFTVLAEGVVRKRHLKIPPPEPEPAPGAPPPKIPKAVAPRKFIYDAMETHSLKPNKNGKLDWVLGHEKRSLEIVIEKVGGESGV